MPSGSWMHHCPWSKANRFQQGGCQDAVNQTQLSEHCGRACYRTGLEQPLETCEVSSWGFLCNSRQWPPYIWAAILQKEEEKRQVYDHQCLNMKRYEGNAWEEKQAWSWEGRDWKQDRGYTGKTGLGYHGPHCTFCLREGCNWGHHSPTPVCTHLSQVSSSKSFFVICYSVFGTGTEPGCQWDTYKHRVEVIMHLGITSLLQ